MSRIRQAPLPCCFWRPGPTRPSKIYPRPPLTQRHAPFRFRSIIPAITSYESGHIPGPDHPYLACIPIVCSFVCRFAHTPVDHLVRHPLGLPFFLVSVPAPSHRLGGNRTTTSFPHLSGR